MSCIRHKIFGCQLIVRRRGKLSRWARWKRLRSCRVVFTISPPLSAWALSIGSSHPSASSMKRPLGQRCRARMPSCLRFLQACIASSHAAGDDNARRLDLDLLSRND